MTPTGHGAPAAPGQDLAKAVLLAMVLFVLPSAVGLAWRAFIPPLPPQSFFIPAELLGVLLPALLLAGPVHPARSLRWRRARLAWLAWAIAGALGWAGLLTYVQTYWQQVTGFSPPPGLEEFLAIRSVGDLLLLGTGAVILPALCEETAFRGFIQTRFERLGAIPAIATTTFLFAAFHLEAYGIPTYVGMGAFLGWLAWRTGTLWPACAAHAANNALALAQVNGLSEAWWWAQFAWLAPLSALLAFVATWQLMKARPKV